MSLNKQVKIILIETTNSGNIGSALRAMKTMGFENLCLVNPKDFPSENVVTMAANAKDLIANIQVCLLYTSPSPRDPKSSRMPSSA